MTAMEENKNFPPSKEWSATRASHCSIILHSKWSAIQVATNHCDTANHSQKEDDITFRVHKPYTVLYWQPDQRTGEETFDCQSWRGAYFRGCVWERACAQAWTLQCKRTPLPSVVCWAGVPCLSSVWIAHTSQEYRTLGLNRAWER